MHITVNRKAVFAMLDTLLERWTATPKLFPYNQKGAIIPQTLVPDSLRSNKTELARFYFYACIYMRGGIESSQAIRALLRMHEAHPELFDPLYARWLEQSVLQPIIKEFIGWDSHAATRNWIENSRRLVDTWKGDPLNLVKNLRGYDEALRRIQNKRTKRQLKEAGHDGAGFFGFQAKMVSMFIYFLDWEGLLPRRFLYPAPADFHNFRLALANGGIVITPQPSVVRASEKLSKPWRDVVMLYLKKRKADPVEVADAIWLFSLVLCGNSPLTLDRTENTNHSGMFSGEAIPHDETNALLAPRYRAAVLRTCVPCPLRSTCRMGIPAGPYYQRGDGRGGKLVLRQRFPIEDHLELSVDDPHPTTMADSPETQFGFTHLL